MRCIGARASLASVASALCTVVSTLNGMMLKTTY